MSVSPISPGQLRSVGCPDISKLNDSQSKSTALRENLVKLTSANRCHKSTDEASGPRPKRASMGSLYAFIRKSIRKLGLMIIGVKSSSHAPASVVKSPRENVLEKLEIFRAEIYKKPSSEETAGLDEKPCSYTEFKTKQLAPDSPMQKLAATLEGCLRMIDDHMQAPQGARPPETKTPTDNTRQDLSPEQTTLLRQLAATLSRWADPDAHQNQVYTFVPAEFSNEMEKLKSALDKTISIIQGTYERDFGESTKATQAEDSGMPEASTNANEPGAAPCLEIPAADSVPELAYSAEPSSTAADARAEKQMHGVESPATAATARPEEQTHTPEHILNFSDEPRTVDEEEYFSTVEWDDILPTVKWDENISIVESDEELSIMEWAETLNRSPKASPLQSTGISKAAPSGIRKPAFFETDIDAEVEGEMLAEWVENDNVSLLFESAEDNDVDLPLDLDKAANPDLQAKI